MIPIIMMIMIMMIRMIIIIIILIIIMIMATTSPSGCVVGTGEDTWSEGGGDSTL